MLQATSEWGRRARPPGIAGFANRTLCLVVQHQQGAYDRFLMSTFPSEEQYLMPVTTDWNLCESCRKTGGINNVLEKLGLTDRCYPLT